MEHGSELVSAIGEAILGASADAILATDRDGVIRFWNPGAVRIFGFPEPEALGASLDIIIPERLRQRHWDGWNRVIATGDTRYGTGDLLSVPAVTKDGRQISVEFTILLLHAANHQIGGIAAVLRDVTKRFEEMRRMKRQLAALAEQTRCRS